MVSVTADLKPTEPALELLRFRALPAGTDVAVLELEGRFAAPTQGRLGRPRLLVQADGRQLEAAAVSGQEAFAGPDAAVWRAVYALPLAAVGGAFTLAVGRRLLLDLPEPDVETAGGAAAAHHVRLAREANALRRRAEEADAGLTAAAAEEQRLSAELAASRQEIERLRGELASAHEATRAADERVEAERAATARTVERVRREADARTDRLQQEHTRRLEAIRRENQDAMATARDESLGRLEAAVAAERAKTLAAHHDLRAARAELEALRHEHPDRGARRPQRAEAGPRGEAAREKARQNESRRSRDLATTTVADTLPGYPDASRAMTEPMTPGGDAPTRVATRELPARDLPAGESAEATTTVRVLNPRARRPRRDLATEAKHANQSMTLPGAAQIGARHISRASRRDLLSRVAEDPARSLAIAAMGLFVVVLLVIVLGISPFQ